MALKRPVPATPGTARACYSPMAGIQSIPPQHVKAVLARARLPQAQPHASWPVCREVHGAGWPLQPSVGARAPCATLRPRSCLLSRNLRWTLCLDNSPGIPHQRCATPQARGGWPERWCTGLPVHGVSPNLPPPAPPATQRKPSHGRPLMAPGGCGSFTHRMSVLAKRSPSIETPSVGATGRALQFRGGGRCCWQQQLRQAGTPQAALEQPPALAS